VGLRRLFGRATARDPEAVARIKAAVSAALALPDPAAITVSEILCPDPACPDLETVILVMCPGEKTRAFKVKKPLDTVTEQDVQVALSSTSGADL
jgi:hypothetical protein